VLSERVPGLEEPGTVLAGHGRVVQMPRLHVAHHVAFPIARPTVSPNSVADPDPGSGAFLTHGSAIGFFQIPDLGSQTHNIEGLATIF
jgi:hypothetical protein